MSKVEFHTVASRSRGEEVEVSVLVPDGYDPSGQADPLILQLHGGGGTRHHLAMMAPLYDRMFSEGVLPRCVVASLSAGASMYIGFEEFVAKERGIACNDVPLRRIDVEDARMLLGSKLHSVSTVVSGVCHGNRWPAH